MNTDSIKIMPVVEKINCKLRPKATQTIISSREHSFIEMNKLLRDNYPEIKNDNS